MKMRRFSLILALAVMAQTVVTVDTAAQTREDRYMKLAPAPQTPDDMAHTNRRPAATSRGRSERRGDRNHPRRIDRDQGGFYGMMVSDATVRELIRRASLSSDRLKAAMHIIDAGGLMTVAQIRDMAGSIQFESDRLKFLMAAYPNCIDRERYYQLVSNLSFSSDKERLCHLIIDEAENYYRSYDHLGGALRKTPLDIRDAVKAVKTATVQSTAKLLARAIVLSYESLSARDLARMSESMVFDNDRLDFLIWAYRYCYDPQNYLVAEQTLTFSSSRDRLYETLSRLRR